MVLFKNVCCMEFETSSLVNNPKGTIVFNPIFSIFDSTLIVMFFSIVESVKKIEDDIDTINVIATGIIAVSC